MQYDHERISSGSRTTIHAIKVDVKQLSSTTLIVFSNSNWMTHFPIERRVYILAKVTETFSFLSPPPLIYDLSWKQKGDSSAIIKSVVIIHCYSAVFNRIRGQKVLGNLGPGWLMAVLFISEAFRFSGTNRNRREVDVSNQNLRRPFCPGPEDPRGFSAETKYVVGVELLQYVCVCPY